MKRKYTGYLLLAPAGIWLAAFFVIPFYSLLSASLFNPKGSVNTGYHMTWHVQNFPHVISKYWPFLLRSIEYGVIATLLCLVLGYVLAYAIAFKAGRWRNLMLVLVAAPFFTSFLVRTLSWKLILGDNSVIVDALKSVHILGHNGHLLATPVAVIAGLTYNFLPFMVLPLYASLEKMDGRLIEAASDLYSTPAKAFWKVTFPLSLPGVVSGTLMTFIPATGDYINAQLLGSPNQRMIGNVIQDLFTTSNDYAAAGAMSVVLMAIILVMVMIWIRKAGTEDLV